MFGCNWGGFGPHMFMGGGLFGGLVGILLLILVVFLAVRFFRGDSGCRTGRDRNDSLTILDERYARGDIDDKEYKRMKDVLTH